MERLLRVPTLPHLRVAPLADVIDEVEILAESIAEGREDVSIRPLRQALEKLDEQCEHDQLIITPLGVKCKCGAEWKQQKGV